MVAEVGHELFGVERPALALPGAPARDTAPEVEPVGFAEGLADLEVVAGNALVEHGGEFLPGVEHGLAPGHGPPHAARAGEVAAGRGVEDAARPGGVDAALDGAHRLGDCEGGSVEIGDGPVGGGLHPFLQCVDAVEPVALVGVEAVHRLLDGGALAEALDGDGLLLGDDLGESGQSPFVGLVEIDGGADELAGEAFVAFPSDAVFGGGLRQEGLAQPGGHDPEGLAGPDELGLVGVDPDPVEGGLVAGEILALGDDLLDLPAGGDVPAFGGEHEGGTVSVECTRDMPETGDDVGPRLGGVGGHDAEGVADPLDGGRDVVELPDVLAGIVEFEAQPEPVPQDGGGDAVDVVEVDVPVTGGGLLEGVDLVEHAPGAFRDGVVVLRGEVLHVAVVFGESPLCRGQRGQRREIVHEGLAGEIESGRVAEGVGAHAHPV